MLATAAAMASEKIHIRHRRGDGNRLGYADKRAHKHAFVACLNRKNAVKQPLIERRRHTAQSGLRQMGMRVDKAGHKRTLPDTFEPLSARRLLADVAYTVSTATNPPSRHAVHRQDVMRKYSLLMYVSVIFDLISAISAYGRQLANLLMPPKKSAPVCA